MIAGAKIKSYHTGKDTYSLVNGIEKRKNSPLNTYRHLNTQFEPYSFSTTVILFNNHTLEIFADIRTKKFAMEISSDDWKEPSKYVEKRLEKYAGLLKEYMLAELRANRGREVVAEVDRSKEMVCS